MANKVEKLQDKDSIVTTNVEVLRELDEALNRALDYALDTMEAPTLEIALTESTRAATALIVAKKTVRSMLNVL